MDDIGLDLVLERLGQALAGGAHPRRIQMGSSPISEYHTKKTTHPHGWVVFLVDTYWLNPNSGQLQFPSGSGSECRPCNYR